MIRGAIEVAQPRRIAGWVVCAAGPLRGKMVLAFSGSRCVGAGSVSIFRPDLVGSDLGDGYAGFDFQIELSDHETIGSVVVRLELCDAALIQANSEVVARTSAIAAMPPPLTRHEPERRPTPMPVARRA